MSGCCVIIIVGVIIQMTSEYPKWYQVVLGRWVAGLGVGALSVLVPLYQSESAPRHIRGAIISCYQLFNTLGILSANCINLGTGNRSDSGAWRIPLGVTFIRILILGIGVLFFPDSPRYDYRAGRIDKAKKSLMRFYGIPHNHKRLHLELEGIREKYEEDMAAQDERWYHMFSAPGMKHRLLLGAALHGLHQLTGANFFFYTAATVFRGFGVQNRYISQVILGAIDFGGSCLSLYTVENFGRRKSLIVGAIWMSVCCAVYASIGHFELNEAMPELTPSSGKAMVVVACLFMLGFASTWGPIAWVIIAEIYPSRYRARAMGLATASNWLWNFLLAFFTPFITEAIDFRYGYIFSGYLFVGVATVYFGVIEACVFQPGQAGMKHWGIPRRSLVKIKLPITMVLPTHAIFPNQVHAMIQIVSCVPTLRLFFQDLEPLEVVNVACQFSVRTYMSSLVDLAVERVWSRIGWINFASVGDDIR
ncbi:monosaccharide transporter [Histoplasma capsulatum H143]|uniref:Monosaccharide transporter n=1 Tax=Ajellomyces capsulatus (strain H143) TaxID=544712 RepID=C6H2Z1_AJECH|nr:monosaccharide transporter [Histoplasma capsulatum H143]